MTKKTSNKNVATEEDVNELKRLLYSDNLTQHGKRKLVNYYDKRIQELEAKLLDTIHGTEIIKKETPEYVKENYIPKQVVIDKIEELKLSGGGNGTDNVENLVRELTIEILQELLGGEK